MGNGALAIGPKLPRPSSTLPGQKVFAVQRLRQRIGGTPAARSTLPDRVGHDPKQPLRMPLQVQRARSSRARRPLARFGVCHWFGRPRDRKYRAHMLGPHLAKGRGVAG